jgi:hypothetical protein
MALGHTRLATAANTMKIHPSMFDRIERIPADFIPLKGKAYIATIQDERGVQQCAWEFESYPHLTIK